MKYFPYDYFSSRLYHKFFRYSVYKKQDAGNYGFGYLYSDPSTQNLPEWMFDRYREVYKLNQVIRMTNIKKSLGRK